MVPAFSSGGRHDGTSEQAEGRVQVHLHAGIPNQAVSVDGHQILHFINLEVQSGS